MATHRLAKGVRFASVAIFVPATAAMLLDWEPFDSWYYCFAWWPYIFFLESHLHLKGSASRLYDDSWGFLRLLPLSVVFWLVFEAYNFRLHNWRYLLLPDCTAMRWSGYAVSFATVLPGLSVTRRFLEFLGLFSGLGNRGPTHPERLLRPSLYAGLFCLAAPLIWPKYAFPLVWLGFFLALEPFNYRYGAWSLFKPRPGGPLRDVLVILTAGLVCGLFWELWNFRASSKWVYTVPFFDQFKVFEMPILGFLGFPPFALECVAMVSAFQAAKDLLAQRAPSPVYRAVKAAAVLAALLFAAMVFAGIDHFTVETYAAA